MQIAFSMHAVFRTRFLLAVIVLEETNPSNQNRIRWPLILSLLCLSVAVLPFDAIITAHRRSGFLAGDVRRIIQLSEIFGHGFGLAVVAYMVWALAPAKRRFLPRLVACMLLPGLAVHIIKTFVGRRRPGFYYPEFTDNASETWLGIMPSGYPNHEYLTQSFPSAHAATAFGLAIAMSWLFPRGRHAFFVFALLAAIQRVVYGAHWASDVFVGSAVGIFVASLVFNVRSVDRLFANLESRGTNESPPAKTPNESSRFRPSKAA